MTAPRVTTALALVTALALIGCRNRATSTEPAKPARPVASDAAKPAPGTAKAAPKTPAAGATTAVPAKPAPAPAKPAPMTAQPAGAPRAAQPARSELDTLVGDRRIREERRQMLIADFQQKGEQAFADSRFDDARKHYRDILDLDPRNEAAQRRLAQIGAVLGDEPQSARADMDTAVDSWRVRVEQAKAEVSSFAAQARTREAAGDYEGAADLYDKALVVVRLFPSTVDFTPTEAGLVQLRSRAKDAAAVAADEIRARRVSEARERTKVEEMAVRAARQARRARLLREANKAMESGNYQSAYNLSNQILEDDPTNRNAKQLRELAFNARTDELDETGRDRVIEEWKRTFEQLAEAATPQTDDYRFPTGWGDLQGRREAPRISGGLDASEDPLDRDVRNRLDATQIIVNFDASKLSDVVDFLRRISGVNIVVLQKAIEGKSDEDLTVTFKLETPIPVSQVLTQVTRILGLAWNIENGVVQITTPEEAQGAFVVQLYDVKDIAMPISQFPGDEVNLDPTGELTIAEEAPEPVAEFQLDGIVELIQNNVDRKAWESGGEVTGLPPGTLIVKAPRETHRRVQQLLLGLRGAGGLQVSIETRFCTVTDNFLQDVGVDIRGLGDQSGGVGLPGKGGLPGPAGTTIPVTFDDVFFGSAGTPGGIGTGQDTGIFYNMNSDGDLRARFENLYDVALGKPGVLTTLGGLSFQGTLIDDTQLEVILRAVQKSDRSTVVLAPKLTAYAGQRANITVLNQVSYISDFDVEIAQAAQIGDPIVQTLRDGVVLDIKPIVTADRRFITMELRPTIAILTRPIATFQTTLAQGPPVTIQLPEIAIQRLRTTVTMPDGGTLLIGGLKFFEERRLESGVPWLNKVPVVNFLLSRKGTYEERRNLLVLIRARIVRPEENEPASSR